MNADALRLTIARAEAGLREARSPRARLAHSFKLALARDALKLMEAG